MERPYLHFFLLFFLTRIFSVPLCFVSSSLSLFFPFPHHSLILLASSSRSKIHLRSLRKIDNWRIIDKHSRKTRHLYILNMPIADKGLVYAQNCKWITADHTLYTWTTQYEQYTFDVLRLLGFYIFLALPCFWPLMGLYIYGYIDAICLNNTYHSAKVYTLDQWMGLVSRGIMRDIEERYNSHSYFIFTNRHKKAELRSE